MGKDLISIIIPIYNVGEYLSKCLDSVLKQTYSNVEIILVDDGSTDECGEICDTYSKKDKRIKVIHKINGGVSSARNAGVNNSKGKYINFIDPDDEVDEKFIETMYKNIIDYESDISMCSFELVYKKKPEIKQEKEIIKTYDSLLALKELLYQKRIDNSLCWKLFKKELFDGVTFPEKYIFEDYAVVYKLFLKSKKIVQSNLKLYYYYQRENSIMHKQFSEKNFDILKISDIMESEILTIYPEMESAVLCRKINAYFYILRSIDKKKYRNQYLLVKKFIKRNRKRILTDKNSKFKTKLGIILSYINMDSVRILYNISLIKKIFYMK